MTSAPIQENGVNHGPDGRFVAGNQAARQTGLYARQQPADVRTAADDLMRGIVSDLGGESELSTLQASYVRKVADIEITIRLLTSDIARHGLLTPGGGVRPVYDKLLAGLDRFDRFAQRLGLERKAKPIAADPTAYLKHLQGDGRHDEAPAVRADAR